MDPALEELLAFEGDDEVEVILRLSAPDAIPPLVRIVSRLGPDIATGRMLAKNAQKVLESETVASLKAPRLVSMDPLIETPAESVSGLEPDSVLGAEWNRRSRRFDGRGTVVCIIDWFWDPSHPNFDLSKVLAVWDQSAPPNPASPRPYGYGTLHGPAAIKSAVQSGRALEVLYSNAARADPHGVGTHGTHVADIAVGQGRVPGSLPGVAPGAELIVVHPAPRSLGGEWNLGHSTRLAEAIAFACAMAKAHGLPFTVNISAGQMSGSHDGTSLLARGIDGILAEAPGRAIVQSVGNYALSRTATQGLVLTGRSVELNWLIHPADVTPNELEIWYSGKDCFHVTLISPQGVHTDAALGTIAPIVINGSIVGKLYHRRLEPNSGKNHIDIIMHSGDQPLAELVGIDRPWKVRLTGQNVVSGRYYAWIERDSSMPTAQSRFPESIATSSCSINNICDSHLGISVGASENRSGSNHSSHDQVVSAYSSRGPTVDGRQKPEILAPGDLWAARSTSPVAASGLSLLTRKRGSSMASPQACAAVNLIFQAGGPLHISETRQVLLGSADPMDDADAAAVGNGCLNIDRAIEATLRLRQTVRTRSRTISIPRSINPDPHAPSPILIPEASGGMPPIVSGDLEVQSATSKTAQEMSMNPGQEDHPVVASDELIGEHTTAPAEGINEDITSDRSHRPEHRTIEREAADQAETLIAGEDVTKDGKEEVAPAPYAVAIDDDVHSPATTSAEPSRSHEGHTESDATGSVEDTEDLEEEEIYASVEAPPIDLLSHAESLVLADNPPSTPDAFLWHLLSESGVSNAIIFPHRHLAARVFNALSAETDRALKDVLENFFDIFSHKTPNPEVRPGCVLIRNAFEGGIVNTSVIASHLWRYEDLAGAGLTPEGRRRGWYAEVIEPGNPRGFARLVLNDGGWLNRDQILLSGIGPTRYPWRDSDLQLLGGSESFESQRDYPFPENMQTPAAETLTEPRQWFVDYLPVTTLSSLQQVEFYVDGQSYCEALHRDLAGARERVYMTGLHFMADFALVRSGPRSQWRTLVQVLRELLARARSPVHVYILVNQFWEEESRMLGSWRADRQFSHTPSIPEIIQRWPSGRPVDTQTLRATITREGGLHTYFPATVEFCRELHNGIPQDRRQYIHFRTDIHPGHFLMHTHHQKTVVIDDDIAYVGGIDLTHVDGDRWDTPAHGVTNRYVTGRKEKYWHDIHGRIRGPAATLVAQNFHDRWTHGRLFEIDLDSYRQAERPQVRINRDQRPSAPPDPRLPNGLDPPRPASLDAIRRSPVDGPKVQIVRSMPRGTRNHQGYPIRFLNGRGPRDRSWEHSAKDAYLVGINAAAQSIYLENQWITDEAIWEGLERAVTRNRTNRGFRIVIMLPHRVLPLAGVGANQDLLTSINMLRVVLASRWEDTFGVYSLVQQPQGPLRSETQIYVHSKIMIVDDVWTLIGSANAGGVSLEGLHEWGLFGGGHRPDTELSFITLSHQRTRSLRRALWSEHLELPIDRLPQNFMEGARLMRAAGNARGGRLRFSPLFVNDRFDLRHLVNGGRQLSQRNIGRIAPFLDDLVTRTRRLVSQDNRYQTLRQNLINLLQVYLDTASPLLRGVLAPVMRQLQR